MLLQEASTTGGMFGLAPLVVFIPLIGMLVNIIIGGRLSEKAVGAIASVASGLAFAVAVVLGFALSANHSEPVSVLFLEWIHIGALELDWTFRVDTLSVTMMLVVAGVGTLIHIYATGYMHEDVRHHGDITRFRRFFVFLNLFIAMMMILVTGDNYLMLFVGWEGVGLCSYLLIGFWYDKGKDGIGNAVAGMKAFVTNRIGDLGMLLAMFLIFWAFGSLQFNEVFERAHDLAAIMPGVFLAITICILVAVAGKSAQIPLYVWLPDAMAGPTPVSALIHAATMVTSGVYLVARSAPIFVQIPQGQQIVALVGGITALFAATIAVGQFDIKKVLAYSTVSQLGFMVAAVGMGAFVAGMFHLVTHAFFKALLFLSSGSVIQGMERGEHHAEHHEHEHSLKPKKKKGKELVFDPQDMRFMGGLRRRMKGTFLVYLVGALALAGIPPLAGFWSKDEILLEANHLNLPVYILLTLAAIFTAFYMGRQVFMVFFGEPRSDAAAHAQESPPLMTIPLYILAGLSILGGLINLPGLLTFKNWLKYSFEAFEVELEVLPFSWVIAGLSTGLALLAILGAWYLYGRNPLKREQEDPLRVMLGPVFTLLEKKYWVDEIYQLLLIDRYVDLSRGLAEIVDWRFWHDWFHDTVLVSGFNGFARLLSLRIDLGGIDRLGNGLGEIVRWSASRLRRIQTGLVRNYALSLFMGVVIIIGYLIFF